MDKQKRVHQLDAAAVALHERRKPASDAEIDARAPVGRINVPKIVALLVGHHLERQLVMIAEKDRPLAVLRNLRRLAHDIRDRERSSLAIAIYMRGISGKWNAMWHSSPSPKYPRVSSGH